MSINKKYSKDITDRDRTIYEGSAKKIVIHAETGRVRVKKRGQFGEIEHHKISKGGSKTLRPNRGLGGPLRLEAKLIDEQHHGTVRVEVEEVGPEPINPSPPRDNWVIQF